MNIFGRILSWLTGSRQYPQNNNWQNQNPPPLPIGQQGQGFGGPGDYSQQGFRGPRHPQGRPPHQGGGPPQGVGPRR